MGLEPVGASGQGVGLLGIDDGLGRIGDLEHAGRRLPHPLQALGGDGKPHDQLEGGQRDEGDDRKFGGAETPRHHRGDADYQATPAGEAGEEGGQGQTDTGRPGRRRCDGRELRILRPQGADLDAGGAEGHQLGAHLR